MTANAEPKGPQANESGSTLKGISNFLSGIILGLTIKVAFEGTFKDLGQYNEWIEAVTIGVWGDLQRKLLVLFQFLVFLFTLLRFYWGAYRYNNEAPESQTRQELTINVVGAFLLFGGFYITAMTIQTTKLFYFLIAVFHLLDFFWFLLSNAYMKKLDEGIRKVISCWQIYDLITVSLFVGFAFWDYFLPSNYYLPQWLFLVGLFLVGVRDMHKFWPFYMALPVWRTQLK